MSNVDALSRMSQIQQRIEQLRSSALRAAATRVALPPQENAAAGEARPAASSNDSPD